MVAECDVVVAWVTALWWTAFFLWGRLGVVAVLVTSVVVVAATGLAVVVGCFAVLPQPARTPAPAPAAAIAIDVSTALFIYPVLVQNTDQASG